ncbi:hypothetical protein [Roseobacter denitrificans]|nr:hypothetical protein [Roseobacter denitrificans]
MTSNVTTPNPNTPPAGFDRETHRFAVGKGGYDKTTDFVPQEEK